MHRQKLVLTMLVAQFVLSSIGMAAQSTNADPLMKLTEWERGVKVESRTDKAGFAYFWFYEWHLFDAVAKGEHTQGTHEWPWTVNAKGTLAQMDSPCLKMNVKAAENGAELTLDVTNTTDYDWPEIAALIPCFNPGNPVKPQEQNPIFLDEGHEHTFFLGAEGLDLIKGRYPREIHFNRQYRRAIMAWDKERKNGKFVFDKKWPTSGRDAHAGLLVRESQDKKWTMAIAWDAFLSAQGHNPWSCMHLSIRVGPLGKGQSKTISGRIYLIKGSKEDCLKLFKKDFKSDQNYTKRL